MIYPNPISHTVNIKCNYCNNELKRLIITNVMGQTLFESKIRTTLSLNMSNWDNGFYIVQVFAKTSVITQKISKE
ncbi:MAG: T9SS type A sorting domain-containing protein [Bacteroidetes bacterium]|nr:T9SS type A sorting domain-containing protein [Bacteroidota bacterium]